MSRPAHDELEDVLELTHHRDPRQRTWAMRQLCPCHLRHNDAQVRSTVLHVLCDGSPRSREQEVIAALQRMQHDTDVRLRRRARKVLAQYRRTGTVNLL